MCLAGKNSVGKTTLLRSVRNLYLNNTFAETAAPYIFSENSTVEYFIDDVRIKFAYNKRLSMIDTKQIISEDIKDLFLVELPIPHGERFNQFRRLSDLDEDIRSKIAVGDYSTPTDLILFLERVYGDNRFDRLKGAKIKGKEYYFILKDESDRYYIREDYFSSGEYFVISLFRHIQHKKKVIFIDEIDISLDASAQVNLLRCLRDYCNDYNVNIVFTTHSLALMKTLQQDELYYIECNDESGIVQITNRSYNFIKSILYGFSGYDKYILTEDERLEDYIKYIIDRGDNIFHKFQIIYVGGGEQVIDLLRRNEARNFLSDNENVIAILDGDQRELTCHRGLINVDFIPYSNIEMEVYSHYLNDNEKIPKVSSIEGKSVGKRSKNLFWKLTKIHNGKQLISSYKLYDFLEGIYPEETARLKKVIIDFLN